MPRIFLSHSIKDNTQAIALRDWLIRQRPELATFWTSATATSPPRGGAADEDPTIISKEREP
jgi:hypothetical protein